MADGPRYPHVHVQLSGESSNVFSIVARTTAALRRAGVSPEDQEAFAEEACSGDVDHLLATVREWVEVS